MRLHIPGQVRSQLHGWIAAGHPHETCGLLLGSQSEGAARVARVVQLRNQNEERAHDRFTFDPDEYFAAEWAAREDGLEVIGVWHSHPDHPARPSITDRIWAQPDWSYVICSVTSAGVVDTRSWRLTPEGAAKLEESDYETGDFAEESIA